MELDIELYVKTCLVCQQDKGLTQKEAGLLQPLPIPKVHGCLFQWISLLVCLKWKEWVQFLLRLIVFKVC